MRGAGSGFSARWLSLSLLAFFLFAGFGVCSRTGGGCSDPSVSIGLVPGGGGTLLGVGVSSRFFDASTSAGIGDKPPRIGGGGVSGRGPEGGSGDSSVLGELATSAGFPTNALLGFVNPRIVLAAAPHDHCQLAAGAQGLAHVAQRGDRRVEEHGADVDVGALE